MGIFRAPNIRTSSLVFCVDPANHKSYSGGSTAYDVGGGRDESSNAYVTLTSINSAGAILNDGVGKRWSLNGSSQYWKTDSSPAGHQPDTSHVDSVGYTVNAWILPDTVSQRQGIFCNDGQEEEVYYGIDTFITSNGELGMRAGDGLGTNPSNRRTVLTSTVITANQWIFASFVIWSDPGKWQVYINGQGTSMQTSTGTATAIGYSGTKSGGIGVTDNDYFDGGIGGLWVYNDRLSTEEIRTIYEKTKFKYNNPV